MPIADIGLSAEDMTFLAVVDRHRRIMDRDWHWRAEEVALDMEETEVRELPSGPVQA